MGFNILWLGCLFFMLNKDDSALLLLVYQDVVMKNHFLSDLSYHSKIIISCWFNISWKHYTLSSSMCFPARESFDLGWDGIVCLGSGLKYSVAFNLERNMNFFLCNTIFCSICAWASQLSEKKCIKFTKFSDTGI